ncbi:sialidase family protein [Rhodoferax sp.]|uniref:exo-alpha-sialidase n=1 Tax=Rhodoferax sp. TaxID=50421 RepID=UPI002611FFB2|nr:sialidase family protein [Rhodoferax sp.]MDD2810506.1 exo-alpha-sialidase [Rhodoferax sp.]MDD4943644.1 exo-alpha-sialidase [Rhodoferax sp.]
MFISSRQSVLRNAWVRLALGAVFVLALAGVDAAWRPTQPAPAQARWPAMSAPGDQPLVLQAQGHIPMPPQTPAAHASSLLAMPADAAQGVLAFWFAGTKESAPDIGIAVAGFDRASQQWQAARFVVERQALGQALGFGVRRIGNPVAWLDADHQVHLFVVATGPGGWAASRIVQLRQSSASAASAELAFEPVRALPLAWGWNISHLVRTAPLPLQDGGMVLPVHFELGLKIPLALRFGARGEFLGMVRISRRTHVLQPTLVMQSAQQWLAFMRDQRPEGRVTVAQTQDGGQHWQDLPDLALVNPDASVAGLGLAPGRMVLAHNTSAHARTLLDLSQSANGQQWLPLQALAHGSGTQEFSYPALAWADDSLWVSYTDQRQRVAWQRFGVNKP